MLTSLSLGQPVYDRVVRGGSWNNNQDNARAAYRNNNNPNNRNNNNGFRVLACLHIPVCLHDGEQVRYLFTNGTLLRQACRFQKCPAVTASGTRQKA